MAIVVLTKSKPSTIVTPNFSATPDCYVGFIGAIVEPVNEPVGFIGSISGIRVFEGRICDNCNNNC